MVRWSPFGGFYFVAVAISQRLTGMPLLYLKIVFDWVERENFMEYG